MHRTKNRNTKIAHWRKIEISHFFNQRFFASNLSHFHMIKAIKTSNVALRGFFQGFQTVMDCVWFRPIVKQKSAKQSVCFLVADSGLYKRLCLSVGLSVCRSVHEHESKSGNTCISVAAHLSATGIGRVSGLVFFAIVKYQNT